MLTAHTGTIYTFNERVHQSLLYKTLHIKLDSILVYGFITSHLPMNGHLCICSSICVCVSLYCKMYSSAISRLVLLHYLMNMNYDTLQCLCVVVISNLHLKLSTRFWYNNLLLYYTEMACIQEEEEEEKKSTTFAHWTEHTHKNVWFLLRTNGYIINDNQQNVLVLLALKCVFYFFFKVHQLKHTHTRSHSHEHGDAQQFTDTYKNQTWWPIYCYLWKNPW